MTTMTTAERAAHLAVAAGAFSFLGRTTAADLLGVVALDLGHREALDRFVPLGAGQARAFPLTPLLHIVAANTPAAALQSLIRGLLIGAENRVKLPAEGLPEVNILLAGLPPALVDLVSLSHSMKPEWLETASAILVFGSDETIEDLHDRVRANQVFLPHGHRISFGVVFDDPKFASVDAAARDASTFDQLGCLSPHVFYVAGNARAYGERLAVAMASRHRADPREGVPPSVGNAIRALREDFHFRASNGEPCAVWQSEASTAWTVFYDESAGFPSTPLHRTIFVKPLPFGFRDEIHPLRGHLSCAGIYPATPNYAEVLAACGVSRICPIGQMQCPPWTWRQDSQPTLAPLVRWVAWDGIR